jgi:hypothetical protein
MGKQLQGVPSGKARVVFDFLFNTIQDFRHEGSLAVLAGNANLRIGRYPRKNLTSPVAYRNVFHF